jgi:hypothetical protein
VVPYPETKYYGAEFRSADDRAQFLAWYEEQKDKMFHNKEELLAYCIDDVNVLSKACYAFRNLFLKLVKMDPFRQGLTISSIYNKVFRPKILKPDTVSIIPRGGYRMGDRQSVEAIQWLAYIGQTRDDVIHAGNGRDVHLPGLPNVKVDGYSPKTQEVFEYLGCCWHGSPCMPNRHKPIGNTKEILLSMYEEATARVNKIESAGYKVVSIWGCEFRKIICENPGLEKENISHPYFKNSPLNIRDPLYGGRTEATKKYYKVKQEEKINYVDVISLCPFISKYGKFPIGHPKVMWVQAVPLTVWIGKGLRNVKIFPPGSCTSQFFHTSAILN